MPISNRLGVLHLVSELRPAFVGLLVIAVVAWMSANSIGLLLGYTVPDPPPFSLLQEAAVMAKPADSDSVFSAIKETHSAVRTAPPG